jgi:phage I-like protein
MTDTTYLLDNYVATRTGQAYRLFPFGVIFKNGKRREITPELASQFKLPHFRPPVKLGSHNDETPAGGHIVALEVREDGLYVVPEWNEAGDKAMQDGAYRYHSPEVIWDDGAIENPTDGSMINGPLVLGDALLHTPHLGEATALYSIEPTSTEEIKMNENVTIPQSLWDKFIAPLFAKEPEVKEIVKEVEPEDYAATKIERDELKAKIAEQETAVARGARVEKFTADLKETKADPALADLLADLPEEKAEAIMRQFKALSAQVDETALTEEKGSDGASGLATDDPQAAFNAAVLSISQEKGIYYHVAFEQVKKDQPDLFKAAFPKK